MLNASYPSTLTGQSEPEDTAARCFFCDTTPAPGIGLVTGPGVNICGRCVAAGQQPEHPQLGGSPGIDPDDYCWFCGSTRRTEPGLIAGKHARICPHCLELCAIILDADRGEDGSTMGGLD